MSAPTKVLRVHTDAPETSVVPVDAYLVNEDGTPFTSSGAPAATVASKLAAGGVEAVTGDSVADVKNMLNKLIAALS